MAFSVTVSFDLIREKQLSEILERRPEVPKPLNEAVKFLLFEHMEKILKEKKV